MDEFKYIQGTPSAVLMPAKNYTFRINEEYYEIKIPRRGRYHELAPEIFDEASGEFDLLNSENGVLFLPAITKVLFATKKYPELNFNQFFIMTHIKFGEEEVSIIGQIIDMVIPSKDESIEDKE